MSTTAVVTGAYIREHLRMRFVLVLMVVVPALFICGVLAGTAAAALAAGWAAALIGW
jgi:hypothetical protein